jgi:hypothetical protein
MTDKREEMYDRWWLVVRPCIHFSRLLRPTRYEGVYPEHTRARNDPAVDGGWQGILV